MLFFVEGAGDNAKAKDVNGKEILLTLQSLGWSFEQNVYNSLMNFFWLSRCLSYKQ